MVTTIDCKVPVENRFKMFLKLSSALYSLNLSEKEIDIVNEFYWRHAGKITTDTRKAVCDKLKITAFNLNNYLGKLRERNVVTQESINEKLSINIMPGENTFSVLLNLKIA